MAARICMEAGNSGGAFRASGAVHAKVTAGDARLFGFDGMYSRSMPDSEVAGEKKEDLQR